MEKYCPNPSCGRVLGEVDYNLCPYCGTELLERVGRQPIPNKLRHAVLERDGHRCVECGATSEETSLEIDHIIPVAKGGTNDISNLQTLCKACNRAKSATVWDDDLELKIKKEQLKHLTKRLQKYEEKLNNATTEDERIEYEFEIHQLRKKLDKVHGQINILTLEINKKREEERKEQEEKRRKEILYKKMFLESSDEELNYLFIHFSLDFILKVPRNYTFFSSYSMPTDLREKELMYLAQTYSEDQINDALAGFDEKKQYVEDYPYLNDNFLSKLEYALNSPTFKTPITSQGNKAVLYYLIDRHSLESVKIATEKVIQGKIYANRLKDNYDKSVLVKLSKYLGHENQYYEDLPYDLAINFTKEEIDNGLKVVNENIQYANELNNSFDGLFLANLSQHLGYKNEYYSDLAYDLAINFTKEEIDNGITVEQEKMDYLYELLKLDNDFLRILLKHFYDIDLYPTDENLHRLINEFTRKEIDNSINILNERFVIMNNIFEKGDNSIINNISFYYNFSNRINKKDLEYIILYDMDNNSLKEILEFFKKIEFEFSRELMQYFNSSFRMQSYISNKEKIDYMNAHFSLEEINSKYQKYCDEKRKYHEKKIFLTKLQNEVSQNYFSSLLKKVGGGRIGTTRRINKVLESEITVEDIRSSMEELNESLLSAHRYCPNCVYELQQMDNFCPNCGTRINTSNKNRFKHMNNEMWKKFE